MPLESATYISDLDPSNPVGSSDLVSSLDDHMRLVKATLQTTFPGIAGAVTATHTELNFLDGVTGTTGTGKLVLDDAPTIADLTVTDSVTLPAGSIADAALSSNVPLKDAPNVFTVQQTIQRASGSPTLTVERTGNTVNAVIEAKTASGSVYFGNSDGSTFAIGASNNLTSSPWVFVSGTEFEVNAGLLDFNGTADISGTLTVGGVISAPNGSAAAPAYSFSSDSDLGIYRVGGNRLGISGNGTTVASFATDEIDLTATTLDFNGDADVSGTLSVDGAVTVGGALTANGNVDINANLDLAGATVTTNISMSGTRTIDATTRLNLTGSTVSVGESGGALGFYGSAGISKPTVGGKINDLTALIALLNQLEALGLITKAWTES